MEPDDGSRSRRPRRVGVGVVVVLVAIALVMGAALWWALGDRRVEPRPAVEHAGWSATAAWCMSSESTALTGLDRGVLIDLGADPTRAIDTGKCRGPEGAPVDVPAGGTWFALGTGDDRDDVRLVQVDTSGAPARLVVEHEFPGDGCGRTDEFRGRLVLLVRGPDGAATPAIRLDDVALRC